MEVRKVRLGLCALAVLLLATPIWAQNPTGTLIGKVTDDSGAPLPGVTVTATSPALQGERIVVTGDTGEYKVAFLPAGNYSVSYRLDGFSTAVREAKLSAAQTTVSNITMELGEISEEIIVTGKQASISESQTVAQTVTFDEVEQLPIPRELDDIVNLTPGVTNSGFRSSTPVIGGAPSFENLYMINGVVINENVRAEILGLFIEDAIQETTTSVSSVPAQYGRFTGGVVNAVTKSGGNTFEGSLRVSLENEDWESRTELSGERVDDIGETYEATLGGFFMKDHLWFFTAGRDVATSGSAQTNITNIQYPVTSEETRLDAKLTLSPNQKHTIIGSYLEIDRSRTNTDFGTILDLRSLNPNRQDPQEISSINYTGILGSDFFIEGQWSERLFTIGVGSGGVPDLIEGTLIRTRGEGFRYWAPTFCGSCGDDEERNNENIVAKGSYFLTTENVGSHDIVFGYDTFDDIRGVINHQTGSDFTVYGSDVLRDASGDPVIDPASGSAVPIFDPNATSVPWIRWFAVFNEDLAQPTSFKTNSFYVNDAWQLNDKWSFNIGVRYDENDGTNSQGATVSDDSKLSPRLGASWDTQGDGDLVLRASYGSYVAGLNQIADESSSGGAIGSLRWDYAGPPINVGCILGVDCLTADEVLRQVFAWYVSQGGVFDLALIDPNAPINQFLNQNSVPGATTQIVGGIESPSVDEFTLGFTKRLGNKGLIRSDLVLREWDNFYGLRTDLSTGTVQTTSGPADVSLLGNFDAGVKREYTGLLTQLRYRFNDKLDFTFNYTWSELEGNFVGESSNSAADAASVESYPEYRVASWNYPTGKLPSDQTHTVRTWATYNLINSARQRLSITWLENFFSGNPYEPTFSVNTSRFLPNPGYFNEPTSLTYFPEGRGSEETDDIHRSDFSINYSFNIPFGNRSVELFVQPEVINVFNEDNLVSVNTSTRRLTNFNPYTTTPVEGVDWERRSTYGTATSEGNFQTPRTFRVSLGVRF